VIVVDDHPAVTAGLLAILDREVGITPCGAVRTLDEAVDEVRRQRPDLVLTDFHLLGGDGLSLCRRLKALREPPRVLLYSVFSPQALTPAALLAGAEGVVSKAAPVDQLLDSMRLAARGKLVVPRSSQQLLVDAADELDPVDRPIFGMRVAGTSTAAIARTAKLSPDEVEWKVDLMLAHLKRGLSAGSAHSEPSASSGSA
jgi:DNA-binding NarL/FixJ family response regulator